MNSGNDLLFSIVVPTFGRPDEVTELIHSLEKQTYTGFELILADGSRDDSVKTVAQQSAYSIPVTHLHKPGLGISESRNWGVQMAKGTYIVFFDSDCVIPPQYFEVVRESLSGEPVDAWGGPDRAHEDFNNRQKAISYAMTSLFTTGGIRGRKNQAGRYQPRSFNFGIRKDVFDALGGFSGLKVSEDIDLSIRLYDSGKKVKLLVDAYVYHKRRSTWYKFFRQVHSFGSGRIDLQVRHRHALKPVHLLPAAFTLYVLSGIGFVLLGGGWWLFWLCSLILYSLSIFLDSTFRNRSLAVGFMSVYAAFVMLTGYGTGMMGAFWRRFVLGSSRESEKPEITKES